MNPKIYPPVPHECVRTFRYFEDETINRFIRRGFNYIKIVRGHDDRILIIAKRSFTL